MLSQIPEIEFEPLVSIIITNYNYRCFLPAAIDSALNQSYHAVEVIVVDDGSTDTSREVINCYGNRILPIFKQNGGQGSAMNAGFYQSHGDIVIFLDADDVLLAGTVQHVVDSYRVQPEAAKIMYRLEVIDAHGQRLGVLRPYGHLPLHSGALHKHVLNFPFDMVRMATSGNSFAAWALKKILPIPEKEYPILADYYLSFITPLFGPVVFLQDIGGYYRIHGNNNHENTCKIDLGRIRRTLTYSITTSIYIRQFAEQLQLDGCPPPDRELLSVSLISERLMSLKLSPDDHPVPGDTTWKLFRLGIAAAVRRFDVSWFMKILYILWFTVMLPAPKPVAYWLANVFSFPEKRQLVNWFLGTLHHVAKE